MDQYILGLSCYYHDSAAALIKNGEIISAAQEERFSRKKHDSRFPKNAISYCLKSQGISLLDIENVVYYEKPLLTFERLLETYLGAAPRGGRSFVAAMQVWLKEKLFLKTELKKNLKEVQASFETDSSEIPHLLFQSTIFPTLLLPSIQVPLKNLSSFAWMEWVSGQQHLPGSGKAKVSNRYGRSVFLTPWVFFTQHSPTTVDSRSILVNTN